MTEDLITRMYTLLEQLPQSEQIKLHEQECVQNPQLEQSWHDFLIEQYLSGNLSEPWKYYVLQLPQVKDEIAFQKDLQKGMRTIQTNALRAEIRRLLPKRPLDKNNSSGKGPRFYTLVISTAAVALLGIGVLFDKLFSGETPSGSGMAAIPVLMVEPFELKGVTEDEIVRGIPQQLPMKLAATEGIYPVTHYAMDHVSERVSPKEITKVVNAGYKVSGTVHREDDELLIDAQLIHLKNNRPIWKERFKIERDPKVLVTALNDVQYAMSMQIAEALNVNVSPHAKSRMLMQVTENAEALKWFLAGEHAWAERSEESLKESIKLFQMALERDSTSTIIRGYLALAYETYAENDYGDENDWAQAVFHAQKALQTDARNPEALVVMGYYAYAKEKDYHKASELFAQALEVQPGDAKIHQAIAELHLRTGNIEIGKEHILIARSIEPENQVVRWVETRYLTASGQLEEARRAANELRAIYPAYPNIQSFDWQYHLTRKEYDLALKAIPADRREEVKKYFSSMVYLEQKDFASAEALYPDGAERPESTILLEHILKDEWMEAYALLSELISREKLHLVAWMQVADFDMFNKMKSDPGIQRILGEHGIKVNMIPKEVQPEM